MRSGEYLASGFRDVDKAQDLNTYSSCLGLLNSLEFFREYKQASFSLLELSPGMSVLEAGSGLGEDAFQMAEMVDPGGKVIGIDKSAHMIQQARTHVGPANDNIKFLQGDVNNLEFQDGTFDRCRIDRTLQHLPDPRGALDELYRVLRPGGAMLAFDNDWETFTFSSQNTDLVRKVCNYWWGSFASGSIGRELQGIFTDIGLKNVVVYPRTLVLKDLQTADRVFDIFKTISKIEELHIITPAESKELAQDIKERGKLGTFLSSYTGFMVAGHKAG